MSSLSLPSLAGASASAQQYLPEPATTDYGAFRDIAGAVANIGSAAIKTTVGGVSTSVGGDFQSLLNQQIAAFEDMQSLTLVSNIERSKHDTKMAAIRNIRA